MSDPALERIERALAEAGADQQPPPGWEARVLAAIDAKPARRAPWWLLVPALAAAAAIVFLVWPRAATPPQQLAVAITIDRGGPLVRGTSAHVGDTLHATATGGDGHRAVWIYRDDRELLATCAGDDACTFTIPSRGDYAIVALAAAAPLPAPRGVLDDDVAAAAKAGAQFTIEAVAVR
ncbi:MAG: hypothetical protein K8W52_39465 [Deltaproteobacteria bacterium]|nr:hypothetical protein [Deltaproteobacteria bacterium]